jgi:3-oxoacyl-[acyl-carrier protein] reductase
MDLGLKDRVALVTGAGSPRGFGKGIALTLAREGCDVIVMDMIPDWAQQTAKEIEAIGRQAMAIQANITSNSEVNEGVKAALARFSRIDILVNNAGQTTPPKPFVEKTEEDWAADIEVIFKGPLKVTRAVLPHMLSQKSGRIIFIAAGVSVFGLANASLYAASKGAIASFVKSLAKEVIKNGIWVNGVAPGLGDTNFLRTSKILKTQDTPPEFLESATQRIPLGRVITPQDIGTMVAYLASEVASGIVGSIIDVDGGQIISQG